ncbi:SDR family NAD(P)-dependent oxidoreductase [Amorphus sp. 3PC139-8]|uniref:SDR family NAD(P)-dependent oxidoreductase n=1 Tax=Amorphus sp. 3PC139-8 TaxID=2735676 RepID=UPI00345CFD93
MSCCVSNQSVIVTGAASGIGKACATYLLEGGNRVLAVDLRQADLNAAFPAPSPALRTLAADISDTETCAGIVSTSVEVFGRVDGLIHWAGRHSIKTWDELTAEDFDALLRVNVTGSFLIAQAVARRLIAQGEGGAIVLTGSTAVIHAPIGGTAGNGGPAYVTSKAAIGGMVRTLARALGPHNIRVNGVAPGVTETPMISNYAQSSRALQIESSPFGRIGSAEEVAEAGCMLISAASRYVSGEMLIVNGATSFG